MVEVGIYARHRAARERLRFDDADDHERTQAVDVFEGDALADRVRCREEDLGRRRAKHSDIVESGFVQFRDTPAQAYADVVLTEEIRRDGDDARFLFLVEVAEFLAIFAHGCGGDDRRNSRLNAPHVGRGQSVSQQIGAGLAILLLLRFDAAKQDRVSPKIFELFQSLYRAASPTESITMTEPPPRTIPSTVRPERI